MLIVLSIVSILCLFLSFALYKQLKLSNQNPELSSVYKNKEKELQNCNIELAKLQGKYYELNEKLLEKETRITDLEKVIQNKDFSIIELKAKNSFLEGENTTLKKENSIKNELEDKLKKIEIENKKNSVELKEKEKNIETLLKIQEEIKVQLKEANLIINKLQDELKEIEIENKKNSVELEEKEKNIKTLTQLQDQIKNQFKVISNEIIKEQKENFNKEQNESLGHLLEPLNKDIKEFKDKIQEAQDKNNNNTTKLEENIKYLLSTTKDIGNKADNLATALKGDKKAQGNWGEFQLQNLLEMSGLEENTSFLKQYSIKNSDNKDFFLDFLIKLPEDRVLIIDSKVSMINYEKYITANSADEKNKYLKSYCEDLKTHIKELGTKEYQNVYKEYNKKKTGDTPDFVFMFVAVEGAYIDAIKFDKTIFDLATKNKVALVTTSSFMPVLRMIEHLWNIENQNKHIADIVDLSKKLYAKMEKFSTDIKTIGDSLIKAQNAYDSAKKYVSTGRDNMLSISGKIIKIADKGKAMNANKIALDFEEDEE